MQKFTLMNKYRSRIKVFEPFDTIMISYGCVYKRSIKTIMKGSILETIENSRKEYIKLLEEGCKTTSIINSYF